MKILRHIAAVFALTLVCVMACGSNDAGHGGPTSTGASCASPTDCFPGVDQSKLSGPVACLDRVPGGYCTHDCALDTDCCAVPGECPVAVPQVCAPFESTGVKRCFLGCESKDVTAAGYADDSNAYCQHYINGYFICRSTGGGSENRKVCVPG